MEQRSKTDDPKKLIAFAKQGKAWAFGKIYSLYFVPVFRYIYLRVDGREEAEDLTQDCFLKVYESLEKFQDVGKDPLAYFFTVARNIVIDYFRRKKPLSLTGSDGKIEGREVLDVIDQKAGPEELLEQSEKGKAARQAIKSLPQNEQEVIILKFISEFSNSEISRLLGKNEAAVRQIQHRALRRLKTLLNGV